MEKLDEIDNKSYKKESSVYLDFHLVTTICQYLNDVDLKYVCNDIKNKIIQKCIVLRISALKYYVYVLTKKYDLMLFNILSDYEYPDYCVKIDELLSTPQILVFDIKDIIFFNKKTNSLVLYNISLESPIFEYNLFTKVNVMCKVDKNHFAVANNNEIKIFDYRNQYEVNTIKQLGVTCMDYDLLGINLVFGCENGVVKNVNCSKLLNFEGKYEVYELVAQPTKMFSNKKSNTHKKVIYGFDNEMEFYSKYEENKSRILSIKIIGKNLACTINQKGLLCYWNVKLGVLKLDSILNLNSISYSQNLNYKFKYSSYFTLILKNMDKFEILRLSKKQFNLNLPNKVNLAVSYYDRIIYYNNDKKELIISKYMNSDINNKTLKKRKGSCDSLENTDSESKFDKENKSIIVHQDKSNLLMKKNLDEFPIALFSL